MPHSTIRILVCDDDMASRILTCIMLGRMQHEAIRCKDAQAALDLLGDDTFALLITDLDMPGMDGIGLIHAVRLREDTAALPILLILEAKDAALVKTAIDAGATNFQFKPLMFYPFKHQVQMMLAKSVY